MSTIEKYIYGIINSNGEKPFNIENENAHVISYDGLSAVVSDAEKVDYHNLPRETLARCLVKHQQVIEKVMRDFTIIPMQLGTFAQDEAEVRRILAKGFPLIKNIFSRVINAVEIDIAATWNHFERILKETGEEPEIKEFKAKLKLNPGEITITDQIKIGAMVKKALDLKREAAVSEIQTILKDVSLDVKTHEVMNDQMVMNAAFLVNLAKREEFDRKIEVLNAKYAEKLNFRCVGPLPPYSFYTLEAKKIDHQEIKWARGKLDLFQEQITKDEVKNAYKKAALAAHPDVTSDLGKEFKEIVRAYKVLREYSLSNEQDGLLVRLRGV